MWASSGREVASRVQKLPPSVTSVLSWTRTACFFSHFFDPGVSHRGRRDATNILKLKAAHLKSCTSAFQFYWWHRCAEMKKKREIKVEQRASLQRASVCWKLPLHPQHTFIHLTPQKSSSLIEEWWEKHEPILTFTFHSPSGSYSKQPPLKLHCTLRCGRGASFTRTRRENCSSLDVKLVFVNSRLTWCEHHDYENKKKKGAFPAKHLPEPIKL